MLTKVTYASYSMKWLKNGYIFTTLSFSCPPTKRQRSNDVQVGGDIRLKEYKSMNYSVQGHQLYKHIIVTITLVRNIVILYSITNILGSISYNGLPWVLKIMTISLSLIKVKVFHIVMLCINIIRIYWVLYYYTHLWWWKKCQKSNFK